eukprot:1391204-Amorphochlora_amoeboformis.AAC.2
MLHFFRRNYHNRRTISLEISGDDIVISSNLGFRVESRRDGAEPLGCGGHRNIDGLRRLFRKNPGGEGVEVTPPVGWGSSTDWG